MDNCKIVKGIFEDFFGEPLVDYSEAEREILVHFPCLTVTNENDKSIEITHLFAKVKLGLTGNMIGYVTLNRSEFTKDQFESDYAHSHLCGINKGDFTKFRQPCFGTGPIIETMNTLNKDFDEEIWKLFCFELSLYVQRESLAGVPYRRLESVGADNGGKWRKIEIDSISDVYVGSVVAKILSIFIKHLASKEFFKVNYINGNYGISMSPYEIVVKLSNEFIDFYNTSEDLTNIQRNEMRSMLIKSKVNDGIIYNMAHERYRGRDLSNYIGKPVCVFKGTEYRVVITEPKNLEDTNISLLLGFEYVSWIVKRISKIINYEYKSTGENRANFSKSLCSIVTENARVL